jgi:hypothetical protein
MANLDKRSDYKIAAQEIETLINLHEKNKSIQSDYKITTQEIDALL